MSNDGKYQFFEDIHNTSFKEPQQTVAEESASTIPEAVEGEKTENPETETVEPESTIN